MKGKELLARVAIILPLALGGSQIAKSVDASTSHSTECPPITACNPWNTEAKVINWLVPGASARGDVEVNGVKYYDNGVGEGTTIINNSEIPLKIYSEWGSGCEVNTNTANLVNKDLKVGCGDSNKDGLADGCLTARIVTFGKDGKSQVIYDKPLNK